MVLVKKLLTSVKRKKQVAIVDFQDDVVFDIEYRFRDDPKHVLRIRQRNPNGFPDLLKENIALSDMDNESICKNLQAFIDGTERQITLVKSRVTDEHKVMAIGKWKDSFYHLQKGPIGKLPDEIEEDLLSFCSDLPVEASLRTIISREAIGKSVVRIDLWGPRGIELKSKRLYGNYPN